MIRTPPAALALVLVAAPVAPGQQRPPSPEARDAATGHLSPRHLRITRNLEYARYGDRRLLLDLYIPARTDTQALPVIVVVRGGGWLLGDKEGFAFIAGYLADAGFASVCIEYRPSGEAAFPAAISDVKAAVRWVRANAARLRFDPNQIGAIGGSSGGHLVALLGASADVPALEGSGGNNGLSSRVAAVVAMAPLTDLRARWLQTGGRDGFIETFLGPPITPQDNRLVLASPINYVNINAPPLLLIHSRTDSTVPYEQSLRLKARYEELGRPVELVTLADAPHAFWNSSRWFPETMNWVVDFFRHTLGRQGALIR